MGKRRLLLILFFLALNHLIDWGPFNLFVTFAQSTSVTATITDPTGLPYTGASMRVGLVFAGTPVSNPTVTISTLSQCQANGFGFAPCQVPFAPTNGPFTLDSTGSIPGGGITLQDNNLVTPSGTQWQFSVSIAPGILPPAGFGPQFCSATITITGAAQNITPSFTCPLLARPVTPSGVGTPGQTITNNGGVLASTPCQTYTTNATGPVNVNCDWHPKINPYVDIVSFGARAVNPNVVPQIPGITANCTATQFTCSISSATTFQNGDGVVIFGAGAPQSMTTPAAPTVTPSASLAGTCTGCPNTPSASGATTYNYKIVARDIGGGLTAISPVGSTTTGQVALGRITFNITSMSRSGQTVTVTTATAHPLLVGCSIATCGEVYISTANALSDVTFDGWFSVSSAVNNTTFTFLGPPSTLVEASSSATGGQANFYLLNKVTFAQTTGAEQYLLCSDRQSSGTFVPVGISNPSTVGNADLEIDDYGSPYQPDNWVFPDIYAGACASAVATSDSLVTTIINGAGSTNLTLANAVGTTVSGATIEFTDGPAIIAAANTIVTSGYGSLTIPADNTGNQFVVNNWTTLPAGVAISQIGPLFLNDTLEVPPGGNGGAKYRGDAFPQFGRNLPVACWSSNPGISVNKAHPGLLFSGAQFAMALSNIQVTGVPVNGTLGVLVEGGFNQRVTDACFGTGTGSNDLLSQAIQFRGNVSQGNTNVAMNFVGFSPGGGADGASHAPTSFFRPVASEGNVDMQHIYSVHRGVIYAGTGAFHLGVSGIAYINGGGTPLLTTFGDSSEILVGSTELDTIAHPAIASLGGSPTIVLLGGVGTTGSGVNYVSGNYSSLTNLGPSTAAIPATWANSISNVTNNGIGSNGQQFNVNAILGDTSSLFTRTTPLAAPSCSVSAGGSVAVATWFFRVVPIWQNGGSGTQSLPSASVTTTPGNQTITCNWTTQTGNPQGYIVAENNTGNANGPYQGAQFAPTGCGGANVLTATWTNGNVCGSVLSGVPTGGPTTLESGLSGIVAPLLQAPNTVGNGVPCTIGELALSAGWQSTGSASVSAPSGTGQTCSWTITTGTTTAANPTITDTLTNPLPNALVVCEMNIHGGTHTAAAGEGFQQTTLSATAPVFTFNGTPTAGNTTYFVTRRCGP